MCIGIGGGNAMVLGRSPTGYPRGLMEYERARLNHFLSSDPPRCRDLPIRCNAFRPEVNHEWQFDTYPVVVFYVGLREV